MAKKSWTVLVLQRERGRFLKLHVNRKWLAAAAVALAAMIAGAIYAPGVVFESRRHRDTIAQLEVTNLDLVSRTDRYEAELNRLSSRIDRFQEQAARLSEEIGVEPQPADAAAGGESVALPAGDLVGTELSLLHSRADRIDDSFARIDAAHQERIAILDSTPNQMPLQGWFSHGFGWRKDPWTSKRQFHRGVDIVADSGTPILVSADGVVSSTARKPDYGKVIDVSHGFGYVTRYAHLSEILVKPGQKVRRGEMLGRVGSTGRSTGPHLHYEVFRDGRRVNPWKYLGQRGS